MHLQLLNHLVQRQHSHFHQQGNQSMSVGLQLVSILGRVSFLGRYLTTRNGWILRDAFNKRKSLPWSCWYRWKCAGFLEGAWGGNTSKTIQLAAHGKWETHYLFFSSEIWFLIHYHSPYFHLLACPGPTPISCFPVLKGACLAWGWQGRFPIRTYVGQ